MVGILKALVPIIFQMKRSFREDDEDDLDRVVDNIRFAVGGEKRARREPVTLVEILHAECRAFGKSRGEGSVLGEDLISSCCECKTFKFVENRYPANLTDAMTFLVELRKFTKKQEVHLLLDAVLLPASVWCQLLLKFVSTWYRCFQSREDSKQRAGWLAYCLFIRETMGPYFKPNDVSRAEAAVAVMLGSLTGQEIEAGSSATEMLLMRVSFNGWVDDRFGAGQSIDLSAESALEGMLAAVESGIVSLYRQSDSSLRIKVTCLPPTVFFNPRKTDWTPAACNNFIGSVRQVAMVWPVAGQPPSSLLPSPRPLHAQIANQEDDDAERQRSMRLVRQSASHLMPTSPYKPKLRREDSANDGQRVSKLFELGRNFSESSWTIENALASRLRGIEAKVKDFYKQILAYPLGADGEDQNRHPSSPRKKKPALLVSLSSAEEATLSEMDEFIVSEISRAIRGGPLKPLLADKRSLNSLHALTRLFAAHAFQRDIGRLESNTNVAWSFGLTTRQVVTSLIVLVAELLFSETSTILHYPCINQATLISSTVASGFAFVAVSVSLSADYLYLWLVLDTLVGPALLEFANSMRVKAVVHLEEVKRELMLRWVWRAESRLWTHANELHSSMLQRAMAFECSGEEVNESKSSEQILDGVAKVVLLYAGMKLCDIAFRLGVQTQDQVLHLSMDFLRSTVLFRLTMLKDRHVMEIAVCCLLSALRVFQIPKNLRDIQSALTMSESGSGRRKIDWSFSNIPASSAACKVSSSHQLPRMTRYENECAVVCQSPLDIASKVINIDEFYTSVFIVEMHFILQPALKFFNEGKRFISGPFPEREGKPGRFASPFSYCLMREFLVGHIETLTGKKGVMNQFFPAKYFKQALSLSSPLGCLPSLFPPIFTENADRTNRVTEERYEWVEGVTIIAKDGSYSFIDAFIS